MLDFIIMTIGSRAKHEVASFWVVEIHALATER